MKRMKKFIALMAVIAMVATGLPMVSMAAEELKLEANATTAKVGATVDFTVTDEGSSPVEIAKDNIECYVGGEATGTKAAEEQVAITVTNGEGGVFQAKMNEAGTYTFKIVKGEYSSPAVNITVTDDEAPAAGDAVEAGTVVDNAAVQTSVFADKTSVGIAGSNRTLTSTMLADQVKKALGKDKFKTIIVATGDDFADGLTVSQLSIAYKAPILLATKGTQAEVISYIGNNLATGGEVIIAGGTGVVSEKFASDVASLAVVSKNVTRLAGANRYETNLAILGDAVGKANVSKDEILIASGNDFADALSASATGKATMIVGKTLTANQVEFLEKNKFSKVTILGGEGAVSKDVELDLNDVTGVEAGRVAGANRIETSNAVAKAYFDGSTCSVYAKGDVFADGLSGGLLANIMNAPIRLAYSSKDMTAGGKSAVLGGIK